MPNELSKFKFLADESCGLPTINLLRGLGHSVVTAKEVNLGGKPDFDILKRAIKEKRILISEDLDFGNILLYPPSLHHGIILLRFRHRLEADIHATLTRLLNEFKPTELRKTLIIVGADKYRLRKE